MKFLLALAFVAVAAGAAVKDPSIEEEGQRIVGGSITNINQYPYSVALLHNQRGQLSWYGQACGGTILTRRTILTAAHCLVTGGVNHQPGWWRARAGSNFASSGGQLVNIHSFIRHPSYGSWGSGNDFDVAVLRTSTLFNYSNQLAAASIAGANYNLGDNVAVWAIGWGATAQNGPTSEQLRHVQVWTVNTNTCRQRYGTSVITDNMLCSGWLDVGGRDQCQGDSGGPLIHNNNVVGVCSFGAGCAQAYFPGVNARVSRFSTWIINTSNSLQ